MTDLPKGTNFDTTNLRPGELIQMEFAPYNVTFYPWNNFHAHCCICKDYNALGIYYSI